MSDGGAGAGFLRRAISSRTTGATCVPSSSIARITSAVRHRAHAELEQEAVVAEDLVLEEDLLDDLLRAADEQSAPRSAREASNCSRVIGGQPRSRPIRFIIAA